VLTDPLQSSIESLAPSLIAARPSRIRAADASNDLHFASLLI